MKRIILGLTLLLASASAQASFEGATVQATYYFPDLVTVLDQQQAVVGPGVEFPNLGTHTNVDFSAENIYFTFNTTGQWVAAAFNGEFFDALTAISPIESVSINAATNMVGLTADRIDWTSTSVSINWESLLIDLSTVVSLDVTFADPGTAHFPVTKTFSDGSTGDVEVTLTCNSGLPLEQSFTISGGGPGVTFVVTELPDSGADCAITESGGHDNYTSMMVGGDAGDDCAWSGVSTGVRTCEIMNEANPATYTVTKDWVVQDERLSEVDYSVDVSIYCDSDILAVGGLPLKLPQSSTMVMLEGDESVDVMVETLLGPANCYAEEDIVQSGVESEGSDECSGAELGAGGSAECVFTNTVFFEGIPTLSQYGMALMALLMLGVGFVGFRRFI